MILRDFAVFGSFSRLKFWGYRSHPWQPLYVRKCMLRSSSIPQQSDSLMTSNSWIDSSAHVPATPAQFDLRPLSTGEVLDRTFQLYRSRFTLFAGLAMLPAAVGVVTEALRLWYSSNQSVHVHSGINLYKAQGISVALALVSFLLSLLLYGITQAA